MSEGNVYRCNWKRTGDRYHAWLVNLPRLKVDSDSLEEALDQIYDLIGEKYGDGEAVLDLDPPTETNDEYVSLCHNAFWYPARGFSLEEFAALYAGGVCTFCCNGIGPRTSVPLRVGSIGDGDLLGAGLRMPRSWLASDAFKKRLSRTERDAIEWRPVDVFTKTNSRFFEMLPKEPIFAVADRKQQVSGWRCPKCGHRVFNVWGIYHPFLAEADIPKPRPSLLMAICSGSARPMLLVERWRSMRDGPGTRKVLARPVTILPTPRVNRKPAVRVLSKKSSEAIHREFLRSAGRS
jgi:hypothetical protein